MCITITLLLIGQLSKWTIELQYQIQVLCTRLLGCMIHIHTYSPTLPPTPTHTDLHQTVDTLREALESNNRTLVEREEHLAEKDKVLEEKDQLLVEAVSKVTKQIHYRMVM